MKRKPKSSGMTGFFAALAATVALTGMAFLIPDRSERPTFVKKPLSEEEIEKLLGVNLPRPTGLPEAATGLDLPEIGLAGRKPADLRPDPYATLPDYVRRNLKASTR